MINRIAGDSTLMAEATDLTNLANLQADLIVRELPDTPALVALGRAGMVVVDWRPGTAAHSNDDGVVMETRAAVSGFASTKVKDTLDNLMYEAGWKTWSDDSNVCFNVIELWAPGCIEYDRFDGVDSARFAGQPVERTDGGVQVAWIGGSVNADEVYRAFPTSPHVHQELCSAWLITIASRTWGESTLFTDLLALLSNAPLGAAPTSTPA
jgi:hypothetical protein